jgi:CRISPR-associated protein Csx10
MTALIVNLTLEQPLLAAGLDGEPNSAVSQKFIPGSLIRGLAIQRYMAEKRLSELDLDDEKTRRLFFSPQTRFLNAYPSIEGQRALPVPRTWRSQKYTLQKVFDEVYPQPEDKVETKKRVKKTFALQTQEGVILHEPAFSVMVHTTRNRRAGKALEEDGAVFRYEALTEGQTFVAVVFCQSQDAELLEKLFKQDEIAYMGKARTAGYGRSKLGRPELSENWQEHKPSALGQQELVLTLASHALLRNEFGHYSSDKSTIEKALQAILGEKISIKSLEVSSITVGGFNRKWGLPLPQALALEMGSVIVLQNSEGLEDAFQKLADEGIGERRHEGFGRILVGWQSQATYAVQNVEQKAKPLDELSLSEPSQALKDLMSRRISFRGYQTV